MSDGFKERREDVQEVNENTETAGKITPAKNRFYVQIWCFTYKSYNVYMSTPYLYLFILVGLMKMRDIKLLSGSRDCYQRKSICKTRNDLVVGGLIAIFL